MNSHYVPQFILKNFCNENNNLIYCDFERKTTSVRNTKSVFAEQDYYPEQLEKDLCHKAEYTFANLYHNKLENAKNAIGLTADELFIIKKYLVVSSIRFKYEFTNEGKSYYKTIPEEWQGLFGRDTAKILNGFLKLENSKDCFNYIDSFEKKLFEGNEPKEDSNMNASLWAELREVLNNYLIFVRPKESEEFFIPDVGRGAYKGELAYQKLSATLMAFLDEANDYPYNISRMLGPRDYMVYPISKKLAIISMSVFYKMLSDSINMFGLVDLGEISSALGFSDNSVLRESVIKEKGIYHYKVKRINTHDVCHLNCISLAQSNRFVACSDLSKVQRSVHFAKDKADRDISFLEI